MNGVHLHCILQIADGVAHLSKLTRMQISITNDALSSTDLVQDKTVDIRSTHGCFRYRTLFHPYGLACRPACRASTAVYLSDLSNPRPPLPSALTDSSGETRAQQKTTSEVASSHHHSSQLAR